MRKAILFFLILFSCKIYSQEKYVTVDGVKHRIKLLGTGEVTVIFENGMSDSIEAWSAIPDSVAKFANVFLYDRADIGKSGLSHQERTIPNMVTELKNILKQEKINPPYVFVGHSMGGFIGRYFASEYPKDVIGLLLLDPSAENFWESMSKKELNEYIEGGTEWYRTKFEPQYWKEWDQFIPNMVYMKDLNIPSDLPIILVSATEPHWYKYQKKIIKGFTNAKHYKLEGSHYVHREKPELTIHYIKKLVNTN